ncbi:MAG TPA: sugar transferase [Candidatus Saccharimonadales bacterium]|nr:sugar transferase [Candidatus Saccharimonadales bacterium]
MKSNASLIYSLVLVVGDFLALVAAFIAAYIIRGHFTNVPVAHPIRAVDYVSIFLLLLPFWILIFALLGLYSSSIQEKRFQELGRLFVGSFVGLLFVIGYQYGFNKIVFPAHLVPLYGFGLAFIFLVIFRNLAREIRASLYKYDIGITNILIVGNTKVALELVENLADKHVSGYQIVGVAGSKAHTTGRFPHLPVFKTFEEAIRKLQADDIHSIVQTELYADQNLNNQILEFAQTHHIAYRFIPGNSEMFVGNIEVELFRSQVPVIAVHQTALIGWGRIVKRLTDLFLGAIFLLIALPFMLLIAIAIKISDPFGPLLFKDPRLTRFGHKAKIYKFRSHKKAYTNMTPEEAFTKMGQPELIKLYRAGGDQIPDDPRVSKIGKFLRLTSLDELPQLINIIKGDISLVGPRALQPHELEQHEKKDLILAIKSGLTGLAQVSGRRSISFEERRKLDLYYVQNWSLWLDLIILLKTVRVVFRRIGAR